MSHRLLQLVALIAGALGAVACEPESEPLDLKIRVTDPNVFMDVETFSLSVLDAQQRPLVLHRFNATARNLRLDEIPFGPSLTFLLEGLAGTPAIVSGQSCPTDVLVGNPYPAISMLVSRVGSFSPIEPPAQDMRRRPLAFVRQDGAVVLAGGAGPTDQPLASADSFDPRTGQWRTAGALQRARDQGAVASLPTGGALMVGGIDDHGPIEQIEVYEPSLGFRLLPGWSQALGVGLRATTLVDGRVLITGGALPGEEARTTALLFENATVHEAGSMAIPRRYHTVSLVGSGGFTGVYLVGGDGGANSSFVGDIEVYNPRATTNGAFGRVVARLAVPRARHTATVLESGNILVAGGLNEQGLVAVAEIFDPISRLVLDAGRLEHPRMRHTATRLRDGRVLIAGGIGSDGQQLSSVEIFDPTIGNFVTGRPLPVPRNDHAAIELCDGTVLLVGGGAGAEIYNPAR